MRKFFTLLTFSILAMAAMAAEITFDPAVDKGNAGTQAGAYTVTKDGITMNVSNGMIAQYKDVYAYRIYKAQTATFTSEIGDITKIEIQSQFRNDTVWGAGGFVTELGTYTANPGEFVGTWMGTSSSIVFNAQAYQVRAAKIIVTVGDAGLLPPSFTPAAGTYYNPVEVSINCGSAGAKIYYTIDGSTPTTGSMQYTAPFTVSSTTTVKAISALDGETSQVVTAIYEITDAPAYGFGSMSSTNDGEMVVFSHDATVIWQGGNNNNYLYAFDETGFGLIYGSVGQTYQIGDVIPAGFGGKKTTYKGEPELASPLTDFQAASKNVSITPQTITASQVNHDNWAHYVVLKNVMISEDGKTITDGSGTCEMYNATFNATMPTDLSKPHDVYGIVGVFNAYQVLPLSFDVAPAPIPEPDPTDVACINDLYNLPKGDKGHFIQPLTTIYQYGPNLYIQDYDGHYSLVYGTVAQTDFVNGDYINDAVASWTTYSGNNQIVPVADTFVKAGHGTPVEPEVMPIEEVAQEMVHWYLAFEDVTIEQGDDIIMRDETGEMKLFDKFGIMEGIDLSTVTYVEGFLTVYKGELELYPISFNSGDEPDYGIKGDVNNDKEVTVADINALIDIIMGAEADAATMWRADVAEDNEIGLADINALVDLILNK